MLAEPVERVIWSPGANWPQWAMIQCPIFEVFFGGARGGGKTDGVLGEFMAHANRYGDKAAGLMVRRTRTELMDTIERSRAIYAPLGWTYQEQDKVWRDPRGARLRFAYLSATLTRNCIKATATPASISRNAETSRARRRS